MRIHPFEAVRPREDLAGKIAAPPYDTLDTAEARVLAEGNPHSFLHINRSEIDLPPGTDLYDPAVYAKAKENYERFKAEGWMLREDRPLMYLYAQTMGTHTQLGLVCTCHIDDYINNLIKKHELTRKDKEDDRTRHTSTVNANVGPVFLAYRDMAAINTFFANVVQNAPTYDVVANDGVRHQVWLLEDVKSTMALFEQIPVTYIADGHHRSASAVRVGAERRAANPAHTGDEEYNWFLAVLFPASQLQILPYNRAVQDLNGLSAEEFMAKVKSIFDVQETDVKSPKEPCRVSMYLNKKWYALCWRKPEGADPVGCLDVSVLQNKLLAPILGIDDPRTSKRINFIGGIRGPQELEKLVDQDGYAVAFSMYPTTVDQLMDIADAGQIMPPKSTWFEPKLRSGLLVHDLD